MTMFCDVRNLKVNEQVWLVKERHFATVSKVFELYKDWQDAGYIQFRMPDGSFQEWLIHVDGTGNDGFPLVYSVGDLYVQIKELRYSQRLKIPKRTDLQIITLSEQSDGSYAYER